MTEHTHKAARLRGPLAALSRMARMGDIPVVIMLAWAGWLAVPWSFTGLAQARAAAAAAATDPPPSHLSADAAASFHLPADTAPSAYLPGVLPGDVAAPAHRITADAARPGTLGQAAPAKAWGIPAGHGLPAGPGVLHTPWETSPRTAEDPSLRTREDLSPHTPENPSPRTAEDLIALERARIAGEVHDAAGHGLAAIAMQAGIALVTLDDDPEQARASLEAIRHTSTTALAQLRTALDRLDPRHHGDLSGQAPPGLPDQAPPGPLDPLTRLAALGEPHDLAGLVDGVRAAGLAVDVLPPDPVIPAHLRGTVYRVIRESLTNVLRHAGPTSAEVRLTHEPRSFVLKVADQGHTRPNMTDRHGGYATGETGSPSAGEGRGLAGMRAAVTEAGGHFRAGPREGGGFQVVAGFPTDHMSADHMPEDRFPQEQA